MKLFVSAMIAVRQEGRWRIRMLTWNDDPRKLGTGASELVRHGVAVND
jgi:hypothetical protein